MLGYGLSIGLSVALSQWVFFRSSVKHASWWLVVTVFGWTIAWAIKIPGSPPNYVDNSHFTTLTSIITKLDTMPSPIHF
jgi:hypothetical protein